MKKKLLAALSVIGVVAVMLPASTSATAPPSQTLVAGKVTYNGTPVKGASVTAVCNSYSKDATTNNNGDYAIGYTDSECPEGKTATVVASKNGMGGTNHGAVGSVGATLNIAIVNVSIPEFGVMTGVAGTAGAAGLFFVMRRRNSAKADLQG